MTTGDARKRMQGTAQPYTVKVIPAEQQTVDEAAALLADGWELAASMVVAVEARQNVFHNSLHHFWRKKVG